MGLPHRKKEHPYPLVTISGDPIAYGGGIINLETGPIQLTIEGRQIEMSFDILPLGNDEAVLGMPWLQEYNPKIDWITGQVDIRDTRRRKMRQQAKLVWYQVGATYEETEKGLSHVPKRYHKYGKKLWSPESEKLSEHAAWDHEIELEPGTSPRFFPIYKLTEEEGRALKEFVQENLRKGYIRPSQSSAGYPVLFVPKKNGKLRLCIDYRQLNSITRKDRYPLPLISEIQDRIGNAQIFTKIDLRWAYHQIRIKEGDEWKAAFRSKEGLYEPLVMQFGLTNAPATFQKRINNVLGEHLDEFVMAYLDDIIIYSMTEEEHEKHVEWVLKRLQEEQMPVAIEKCEFFTRKTDFVGFIIEPGRLSMDPKKIEAIVNWQEPENVTQLRSFLGFCNYYRRFMAQWSKNIEPFTRLTKKEEPWVWAEEQKKLFKELKELFTQEPILKIYQPGLETVVETDASDFALGACFIQRHEDGWHPVAYYSRKMTPPELNYDIYNKELLGIVAALKEWRAFLQGTEKPFVVKTDHKNLTGFLTTKELNRRQVRWAETLADYHFEIQHTKGTDNAQADALSRKAELQNDEKPSGALLRKDTDGLIRYNHPKIAATQEDELERVYETPESFWAQRILEAQLEDPQTDMYENREAKYIPRSIAEQFVEDFHKGLTQGHNGATGLVSRLQEEYIIDGIWRIARKVTKECPDCQRNKPTRHKPYGGLQPVEIPERPWEVISWDFIVKLPKSRDPITGQDHDAILVIVDKLTKWGYFIACTEEISAEDVARIYVKEVFARHGAPSKIISDRDPRFVAAFWEVFLAEQGVRAATSTAYHPQTDGQTERLNQTLEQYLRHYVNHAQNNWVSLLPIAQFAYNATPQEGMGTSPFKANYGYEPRTSLSPRQAKKTSSTAKQRMETLMNLHKNLTETAKVVQQRMKKYYDAKRSEGPDLKEGDKVWLLHKNFKSRRPSKKLDHVRLGPFEIIQRISPVTFKLNLPAKMKIYPVQHIAMLEPAHGNVEPPVYEEDTYRGQEEDEWQVSKIVNHKDVDDKTWYEVKWTGYNKTTWEPLENLKNAMGKVQEYRKRIGQVTLRKNHQRTSHLRGTQEERLPNYSELFPSLLEKNPFFHHQVPADLVPQVSTPWNEPSHEPSQDEEDEQKQKDELRGHAVEQPRPLAPLPANDAVHPERSKAHHRVSQQQIEHETLQQITQGTRRLLRVIGRAHSASDTERTSQDERTFALVHSEQEEGCRDEGLASATQTNPSFAQREHGDGIISPSDSIEATVRARRCTCEEEGGLETFRGIMSNDVNQIDQTDITPLVNDLEMLGIFEDEDEEEGDGVTDALSTMLRLLGEESEEASWLIQARSRMEPVEPCDEEW